ncbi:MAG: sulfate reduction electron transfer complex DsrMKJOP subunit DsrM [Acidobacteria bacterium]|nr:sulfate reduction electron transfer complex DsrMKJOP subunit DsrM [Acidobacteriota bacterium]
MKALIALCAVIGLAIIAWVGVSMAGLESVFGIVVPYAAIAIFLVGFVVKVIGWARAPVPFRITTVAGQAKSLPWIERQPLESPFTTWETIGRMALEVFFFRSLWRNSRATVLRDHQRVAYVSDKILWAAGLAFHVAFLVIFLRHLRFFLEPTPVFVTALEHMDGFFQLAVPAVFMTDAIIVLAVGALLVRRLIEPQLRYLSLPADYFALFLLLGVAFTGISMRYVTRADITGAKALAMGLVTFQPTIPEGIGAPFYLHVFFVSLLFAYFPFSKLMHMGGVFLSPTRNLANNNRAVRHVNPWNPPYDVIKPHTYEEWEEEFHDKLKAAGYTLERE